MSPQCPWIFMLFHRRSRATHPTPTIRPGHRSKASHHSYSCGEMPTPTPTDHVQGEGTIFGFGRNPLIYLFHVLYARPYRAGMGEIKLALESDSTYESSNRVATEFGYYGWNSSKTRGRKYPAHQGASHWKIIVPLSPMTLICSMFVTVIVLPPSPDLKMTLPLLSKRVKFF